MRAHFALAAVLLFEASLGIADTAVSKVDRIVVTKSAHTMQLLQGGKVLKTYSVALSREPIGAKQREGDHKVPEGKYVIDSKKKQSRFHLALHISYPNAADRERARKLGVNAGVTLKSTVWRANTRGLASYIGNPTGLMDASQ